MGEEQAVASAIRERAAAEHAPVTAVLAPPPSRGYVIVEGLDLERLTSLVGAVRHARGVVSARGGSADPGMPEISRSRFERFLAISRTDGELPPLEELLGTVGEGAPRPKRRSEPAKAGGGSRPPGETSPEPPDPRTQRRIALTMNLAIVLPPLALAVGLLAAPQLIWDGFLYPYFWSSIEADAQNVGGAAEAYNVVNTLVYALLLVPALLLIWRVLERIKVRVDARFIFMLTPFVVLGGAARAMEDALYFREPFVYAFISPNIYVAEGFLVLAFVVASWWAVANAGEGGPIRGVAAWAAVFTPGAVALFYLASANPSFVAATVPAPILVAALAAAFLAGVAAVLRMKDSSPHGFVLIAGLVLLGVVSYFVVRWAALGAWEPGASAPVETHLSEGPVILALATLSTVATMVGLWLLAPRAAVARSLLLPINALVYFGQYLDGAATYWGIDQFGYQEKHVLTGFFIDQAGTAVVMFPVKLVFVTFVLYLMDVTYRDDLKDADGRPGTLVGLLKLTVLAVGMGPGTRDMLRLVMGV